MSILYVISPVDLLPEAVLGVVGLIDDFAVIMGYSISLVKIIKPHISL